MRKFQIKPAACAMVMVLFVAASAAQLRQVAIVDLPGPPGFDAITLAGKYVVIAHTAANTVDVFDPALRRVAAEIKGLSSPRGLAVDPGNLLYIANSGSKQIAMISVKDWSVAGTIPLQDPPDSLVLVPERNTLYATNWHEKSLTAIRLGQDNTARTIALDGLPERMAFDPKQDLLFVSVQGNSGIIALGADNAVVRRYKINAPLPTGLAFDLGENKLYVAVRSAVLVIDPRDGAELGRVPSSEGTDTLWYDNATHSVYAASEDGRVNMINSQAGRFFSKDELQTTVRGHTLAYDPGRNFVYVPGGRDGQSKLVILRRVENPAGTQQAPQSAQAPPQAAQQKVAEEQPGSGPH